MQSILFICTGNVFRSLVAEHALKALIGSDVGYTVNSAGIEALPQAVHPLIRERLRLKGCDLVTHEPRKLSRDLWTKRRCRSRWASTTKIFSGRPSTGRSGSLTKCAFRNVNRFSTYTKLCRTGNRISRRHERTCCPLSIIFLLPCRRLSSLFTRWNDAATHCRTNLNETAFRQCSERSSIFSSLIFRCKWLRSI